MQARTDRPGRTVPGLWRWSRADYRRLGELGFFEGQRVELIGGQVIEGAPEGPRHAALAEVVRRALATIFPAECSYIRTEKPLALGRWDEPEPDVAVVEGEPLAFLGEHPTADQALLVVELADTTLAYDRGEKADVYAAAGIADYWIVSLPERLVEVCRGAASHPAGATGARYADRRRLAPGEAVAPLAAPDLADPSRRPAPVALASLAGRDEAGADGVADEFGAVVHGELGHQVGAVGLDRLDADAEGVGDGAVAEAERHLAQHLALARRQAVGRAVVHPP
jgi:Uma2 family endonuclease